MHQKVSTELDEALVRRARLESLRQGKPFVEILKEALESYLGARGVAETEGIVKKSWASLPIQGRALREILEEEDGLLDS